MKWTQAGGTITDNCIVGCVAFAEGYASTDPSSFLDNQLAADGLNQLYLDEGTTFLGTAAQIDALSDMTASGTLTGYCTAPPYATP